MHLVFGRFSELIHMQSGFVGFPMLTQHGDDVTAQQQGLFVVEDGRSVRYATYANRSFFARSADVGLRWSLTTSATLPIALFFRSFIRRQTNMAIFSRSHSQCRFNEKY